jgi:hypothetical protein
MSILIPYFTTVISFDIITSFLGQSDKYFTSVPKIISIYFLHALTGQAL